MAKKRACKGLAEDGDDEWVKCQAGCSVDEVFSECRDKSFGRVTGTLDTRVRVTR